MLEPANPPVLQTSLMLAWYFSLSYYRSLLNNALSITGTITTHISFYIYIFFLPPLFFIFPTTDLQHNNPCNYSTRLILTILSFFFAYLSSLYFFLYDILCIKQNKMVVVVIVVENYSHLVNHPR